MNHVPTTDESRANYRWIIRHDPSTICTWSICDWDMIHSWLGHDSSVIGTWFIRVWHGVFICLTWRIHEYGMTHPHVWHDAFIVNMMSITWHDPRTIMTHSYVWRDSSIHHRLSKVTTWDARDSFVLVAWLILMCDMTHPYVWHASWCHPWDYRHGAMSCVTWLMWQAQQIHKACDIYSYVWHDSSTCVTWLIHIRAMTHPYVAGPAKLWREALDVPIHTCDMTHAYIWHNSFICVTWLIHMSWNKIMTWGSLHSFIRVTRFIHIYDRTHSYVWHDSPYVTGPTKLWREARCTHSYVWHDSFICMT